MPPKAINPEKRLQESVARDIKVRQLEEHTKRQADVLGVARWENALNEKDELHNRKRVESQILLDSQVAKISNTLMRRQRLEQLYQIDEIRYEQELNDKGLALVRDRS
jgi:hypothetical protein